MESKKLLDYYERTIRGLVVYYPEVFGNWTEDVWIENTSVEFTSNINMRSQRSCDLWVIKSPTNFKERDSVHKYQPGYYGSYPGVKYEKELVDVANRRMLYMSSSNRGAAYTYNVFISAPSANTIELAELMNTIFVRELARERPLDQVGEIIKKGASGELEDETSKLTSYDIANISIHPFKLSDSDTPTIGILFSYKELSC
jgi:hypothetical protein